MNILYAIPNYECNLNCEYCKLKDKKIEYNEELFLKKINEFNGEIILFGGEPTLYTDRLEKIIFTGKINSITSNLVDINDVAIELIKDCFIATTYRPSEKWTSNLQKISKKSKYGIRLLFTLTDSLINTNPQQIINNISDLLNKNCNIDSILFEQLLDENKSMDFYRSVDKWLHDIHFNYGLEKTGIRSIIIDQILNGWVFDCTKVKTLEPDGNIKLGCPQRESYNILKECYSCEKSGICRPCILQNKCVYPHYFGNEVLRRYDKKKRL